MDKQDLSLKAATREVFGKKNKGLRRQGKIPAVLYGHGENNQHLELDAKEFAKVYRQAGENTLVTLTVDDKDTKKVLIHEVADHYSKNEPIHADFYEVDLTKKITTHVPLHFVGISLAEKELAGVLVKSLNEVEVEALPTDLPHSIEIDISSLKTFEDEIRLKDLHVPGEAKIVGDAELMIVQVQPPRTQAELEELETPTTEEAEAEAVKEAAGEEGEGGEAATEGDEGEKKDEPAGEEKKEESE